MKVGQVIASLDLRYGGPSRSVRSLAYHLSDLNHEVDLLTLGEADGLSSHPRVQPYCFKAGFPQFAAFSREMKAWLIETPYDCLHHHGLWLRTLHYSAVASRMHETLLVVSPRGMLNPWAKRHHGWKKAIAQTALHPRALEVVRGWHATSNGEADEIRASGYRQPVCVAPNGVSEPNDDQRNEAVLFWHERVPETKEHPTALFYSRFHSKKRVLELIDLWSAQNTNDWILLMVGIPDEYTVDQLKRMVRANGLEKSIFVFDGTSLPQPYPVADLFLLPSHSENFGMVIAEAMAAGVPVITTDATPWSELNEDDIGWCVPWDRFGAAMKTALELDSEAMRKKGKKAHDLILSRYSWHRSAELLADFYRSLL